MCIRCELYDNTLRELSKAVEEGDFEATFRKIIKDFYDAEATSEYQDTCSRQHNYQWVLDEILTTEFDTLKRMILAIRQE
jgi:hypothetical protein